MTFNKKNVFYNSQDNKWHMRYWFIYTLNINKKFKIADKDK